MLGKPFRVALPTYAYAIAFGSDGRFLGISAEGPSKIWPEGAHVREVAADPEAIAGLVKDWNQDRPQTLKGLIWYRLPVSGDRLNWSWPTLSLVMSGKVPRSQLRAEVEHTGAALVEIALFNAGTADAAPPCELTATWREAQLLAADALQGFEASEAGPNGLKIRSRGMLSRLLPGERRTIGWMRFDTRAEVAVDIQGESR